LKGLHACPTDTASGKVTTCTFKPHVAGVNAIDNVRNLLNHSARRQFSNARFETGASGARFIEALLYANGALRAALEKSSEILNATLAMIDYRIKPHLKDGRLKFSINFLNFSVSPPY